MLFSYVDANGSTRRKILPQGTVTGNLVHTVRSLASGPASLGLTEQQAFRFFISRTASCFTQDSSTSHCDSLIVQMSDTEPSLMSAMIAVGAMHHARTSAL